MSYSEVIKSGASPTDIQKYLVDGETVAVTIRIPKNLRDSAKEVAVMRGTNFSALTREAMINEILRKA